MSHHDPIDALLRDAPYLDDAGFTDGVMARLPPRRASHRGRVLAAAGVVAGALGAVTLGPAVGELGRMAAAGQVAPLVAGAMAAGIAAASLLLARRTG